MAHHRARVRAPNRPVKACMLVALAAFRADGRRPQFTGPRSTDRPFSIELSQKAEPTHLGALDGLAVLADGQRLRPAQRRSDALQHVLRHLGGLCTALAGSFRVASSAAFLPCVEQNPVSAMCALQHQTLNPTAPEELCVHMHGLVVDSSVVTSFVLLPAARRSYPADSSQTAPRWGRTAHHAEQMVCITEVLLR